MMNIAKFDLQQSLENNLIKLKALQSDDFEKLYEVASDPLIWEQHPNKDRYKRDVFETFFRGALESKGAFLVFDAQSDVLIGSTRYYGLDPEKSIIAIGYTFLARDHWGSTYNPAMKALMLNYAFKFVDTVKFHIGAHNVRSQTAITRLGASKIGEEDITYYGESPKLNFIYKIEKANWLRK